jgi:hypothetical protein
VASSGSGFKAAIFEVVLAQPKKRVSTTSVVILESVFKTIF